MSNLDEQRILDALERVSQVEPAPEATAQAIERARQALTTASGTKRIEHKRRLIQSRIVKWLIPAAAAILVPVMIAVWLTMSGPGAVAAPTWADMDRQTKGIDRVYIDARVYQGEKLSQRSEMWIKSPGVIRNHDYEVVEGKMVPTECSIATATAAVRWDERTKLGEHASTGNRYMVQSGAATHIEAVLGISLLRDRPDADIRINGEQVVFEPVGQKHPQDATLRGFKLKNKTPTAPPLPQPFTSLIYWFAQRSNTLRRLTVVTGDGDEEQRSDVVVDLDPVVPAGWFDVAIPAHCIDVAAGVAARLSPEVREVYDKVTAARKRFGDYRAVIWRDRTGGWPSLREARRGEQWRCDIIDWGVMHGALIGDNRQGYVRISPEDPFEKVWEQVNRPDYELEMSAMNWRSKFAILHYKLGGRGPRVSAQLYEAIKDGYDKYFAPSLRLTAWPEWMWWENLQPHGWDLRTSLLRWRLGPADPDHPERVEVVGEREKGHWTLVRYTFDRDKDWLCVRQEWGTVSPAKLVWETTAFGQTPDGLWYPREADIGNSHYEYAVQRGAGQPAFFDYPKGMPQPAGPFAEFQSQADQAAAPRQDLPPTAKDKYQAIPARGLPRGFDDKAQAEANSEMVRKMEHISLKLNEFAYEHKWVYPERLQIMVDEGYLKTEDLRNPLHPGAIPPWGYIRPNRKLPNSSERMVLYEPFKEWPGVVAVAFQDHSVEYIHDKAQFERLVQEATRPEPPSRPETPTTAPAPHEKPSATLR